MNGKGDRNRSMTQAYRDGWERIFGMTELSASPELDRAVAEAIRLKSYHMGLDEFRPSTDLNAAFAAAGAVGLFHDGCKCLQQDQYGNWSIVERYGDDGTRRITPLCIVFAPTPALAICAAILKLKGASHAQSNGTEAETPGPA